MRLFTRLESVNDSNGVSLPAWIGAEILNDQVIRLVDVRYPENTDLVPVLAIWHEDQAVIDAAEERMLRWRRRFGMLATLNAQHWRDGEE